MTVGNISVTLGLAGSGLKQLPKNLDNVIFSEHCLFKVGDCLFDTCSTTHCTVYTVARSASTKGTWNWGPKVFF